MENVICLYFNGKNMLDPCIRSSYSLHPVKLSGFLFSFLPLFLFFLVFLTLIAAWGELEAAED